MSIGFEIAPEIEQQLRTEGVDLGREEKEVYLMEQFRLERITHRQLQAALCLGFQATEELLKQRGMGQDFDLEEFGAGRRLLEKARLQ